MILITFLDCGFYVTNIIRCSQTKGSAGNQGISHFPPHHNCFISYRMSVDRWTRSSGSSPHGRQCRIPPLLLLPKVKWSGKIAGGEAQDSSGQQRHRTESTGISWWCDVFRQQLSAHIFLENWDPNLQHGHFSEAPVIDVFPQMSQQLFHTQCVKQIPGVTTDLQHKMETVDGNWNAHIYFVLKVVGN